MTIMVRILFNFMADFLIKECTESKMSMIGYVLSNTLSDHGTVNRGVCQVDEHQNLIEVNEKGKISNEKWRVKIQYRK